MLWRGVSLLCETRTTPGRVLKSRAVHEGQPTIKRGLYFALVGALELLSASDWNIPIFIINLGLEYWRVGTNICKWIFDVEIEKFRAEFNFTCREEKNNVFCVVGKLLIKCLRAQTTSMKTPVMAIKCTNERCESILWVCVLENEPSLGCPYLLGSVAHPRALVGKIKASSWSRMVNLRPLLACTS
jgi:hypothetical protein